jgi:hypothetical protein
MRRKIPRRGAENQTPLLDPHALGLAAVAAELNLKIDTLEPEVGQAVEKGAAALYLAGYGPRTARVRARRQIDPADRRAKAGRVETAPAARTPAQTDSAVAIKNVN